MLLKAYRSFVVASTTILALTLGPIGVHVPMPAIVKAAVHNAKIETLIVPSRLQTRRRTSILLFNLIQRPNMEPVLASEITSVFTSAGFQPNRAAPAWLVSQDSDRLRRSMPRQSAEVAAMAIPT